MYTRIGCLLLCLIVIAVARAQGPQPPQVAAWTEARHQAQRKAAETLATDLARAVRAGEKRFVIAPGEYRFDTKELNRLRIAGARGLSIEAAGVTFWFNGKYRVDAIQLVDCEDVTVRGLSVDYDPVPFGQARIDRIDTADKAFEVTVNAGYQPLENFRSGEQDASKVLFFGPDGLMRETRMDWLKEAAPLEPGEDGRLRYRVRLKTNTADNWNYGFTRQVRAGDRLVVADRTRRHAFDMSRCARMTLEDVTVYASPHMAFVEHDGEGANVYRRCRVVRRPETDRMLACNADVLHSTSMVRGPLVEGCEFSFAADDLMNVHGFYKTVLRQDSPTRLVVGAFFGNDIRVGEEMIFYAVESLAPIGSARVLKAEVVRDPALEKVAAGLVPNLRARGYRVRNVPENRLVMVAVELEKPVTAPVYSFAEDFGQCGNGLVVRDNYFHDVFTRAILAKGRDIRIENNRFERVGMAAILVANDLYFWEAPHARGMKISGNHISDTPRMLGPRLSKDGVGGAISILVGARGDGYAGNLVQHQDIEIRANTIENAPLTGIFMANTRGARIEGNTIINAGNGLLTFPGAPDLRALAGAIVVRESSEITQRDNTVAPQRKGKP